MIFKKIKPTTPSQRHFQKIKIKNLNKTSLLKKNVINYKRSFGKNNTGKITSYHKGGGHKKKYRKINFIRTNNSVHIVTSIEYDPYRNCHIAAVYDYIKNKHEYIISPKNLKIGDVLKSGNHAIIKIGHSLKLSQIPIGVPIHNVSIKKNKHSVVCRSAGMFSKIIKKTIKKIDIRLSNYNNLTVSSDCFATIGIVSNENYFLNTLGKAGRSRWLNRRPKVRGVAMNPIDHPHGGGEGKTSGGRMSVSPWGKPCKGGGNSFKNKLY
jgi:large subunit ribosomal protein L2